MKPLDKALRNQLEKTVREAREVAEKAAKSKLEQLGVGEANPFFHLTEEERELRRKLLVHGRQLGDKLNGEKVQTMERLIEEVAYEHWHRMLFARFLAENNLLMYPDPANPVPITLEECEDLAAKEGAKNGWELAARFAARMLPQIFRPNSPVFQLALPPEHEQTLEKLLDGLPSEVFTASDSIGWVYQFWQAKEKDEVNASEVKIGAKELPAVTQIFTESYMVSFLLDNSLGAWWAAHRLTSDDLRSAKSEDELRQRASLQGVSLNYLRFVRKENCLWAMATCNLHNWPDHLSELKILDPCCGSGHFLVAAFLMLVPIRMELEKISAEDAVDLVLKENIHGLEIDQRCVELAAFSLALAAWTYPNAGSYRQLPQLNVACSGMAISASKEEWLAIAAENPHFKYALEELHKQFKDAPILGSLINPEIGLEKGTLFALKLEDVAPILAKALPAETSTEIGVVAQGLARASSMMYRNYHLLVTNVPYLVRGKHDECLKAYLELYYPNGKHDLAYAFLERCIQYVLEGGQIAIVLPENWLYINPCKKLREEVITNYEIGFLVRLGPGAFQTISGEVVKGMLLSLMNCKPEINHHFFGLETWQAQSPDAKMQSIKNDHLKLISQSDQRKNPDYRISIGEINSGALLSTVAEGLHGQGTFDKSCFVFQMWELPSINGGWVPQQSTPSQRELSDYGASQIFRWENGNGLLYNFMQQKKDAGYTSGKWKAGVNIWGSKGIAVSGIGYLYIRPYLGKAYDENIAVIHPRNEEQLPAIASFIESDDFQTQLRKIDSNLKASCNTLVKVPFDLTFWSKIAEEKYPKGIPKPCSDNPTQWIFHGHPAQSDEPLQVAVARLLGYRWPAETDNSIELSQDANQWLKKLKALFPYVDEDGIVCIPSVRGEQKAEDLLENLLASAFGIEWSPAKKAELLAKADHTGKTLESWLRDKFFIQHCKLFGDRPFIWHIWDGLNDGFSALVNYHKLDYKLLETLIYTYLGDWISQQRQEKARSVDGAETKLDAAEGLKKRLELILKGEKPYDIFVRWKPIEQQPIGWNPELNDGVRVNIRPFMIMPDGEKGAGVLRNKPNITWGKDRGKDVESAPWFKLGLMYDGHEGDRINDHHLSLAEKRSAREKNDPK
jgi:hypothetical protein